MKVSLWHHQAGSNQESLVSSPCTRVLLAQSCQDALRSEKVSHILFGPRREAWWRFSIAYPNAFFGRGYAVPGSARYTATRSLNYVLRTVKPKSGSSRLPAEVMPYENKEYMRLSQVA
jgi:hypothetical protein